MEEDIKILEERVTTLKRHIKNYEESDCKTNVYQQLVKECKAIEKLLKRYKELEEENEKLIEANDNLKSTLVKEVMELRTKLQNNIPTSVIQKKLEKLKREFDFYAGREHFEWQDGEFDGEVCDDIALKIGVLKELLEEGRK